MVEVTLKLMKLGIKAERNLCTFNCKETSKQVFSFTILPNIFSYNVKAEFYKIKNTQSKII